jgi:phosphoesterase RecJ-like protein
VDPSSPATGYQIYELAKALDAGITPEVATCLYCAVGTDSGYFRYKNTTSALLRMAAEMIECGADPKGIAEATLDRYDPSVVRLGGAALSSLDVRLDGRAAVGVLRKSDFDRAGTTQTEGVIDYLRSVAGVDLLILIREADDGWRVSMRSLGGVDVSAPAKRLGGGGHAPAAGCTLHGDLEAAWRELEAELRQAVERSGEGAG